jgi:type I restriction enzyme, S subunit
VSAAAAVERAGAVAWMGKIPAHWDVARLKYVAKLGTGHTPSRQHPEYWEDCTIPWVTLADVWQLRDGGRKTTITETAENISELGLANSAAVRHPKGTVILSRTASVGFSAVLGVDAATSQDFMTWTCGPRLEPMYLLYVLRAMKQEFRRLVMGSTHKTIYMPDIERLTIPLPLLEDQREIVAFLDAELARLDDLLEKKKRLIELLIEREGAARLEMMTRGTAGGDCALHTPMLYVPAVPAEWKVVPLRRIPCIVQTGPFGSQLSADEYVEGGVPVINPAHLVHGKIVADPRVTVSRATLQRLARHKLREGDIVFARRGDLGRAAIVSAEEEGWLCGTGSLRVRLLTGELQTPYLRHYIQLPILRQYFGLMSVGSTMENLNTDIVLGMPVVVAPREKQDEIAQACDELEATTAVKIGKINTQIGFLGERRDAVIAAAVTGRLRED